MNKLIQKVKKWNEEGITWNWILALAGVALVIEHWLPSPWIFGFAVFLVFCFAFPNFGRKLYNPFDAEK